MGLRKADILAAAVSVTKYGVLPTGQPTTSHTGELARAFARSEAVRAISQTAGSGRVTSGGHRPSPGASRAQARAAVAVLAARKRRKRQLAQVGGRAVT